MLLLELHALIHSNVYDVAVARFSGTASIDLRFWIVVCDLVLRVFHTRYCSVSLVPRPLITANTVEGLVKLLCRMSSGGHLEAWHFR